MDEEFAKRALGSIIRNPNPDYDRCRINYLKNLDNKWIFYSFQEIVNHYLNCFKGNKEPTRQDEQSVIPQRYIDEYKKNDSDEVVFMAFSRLLYCNPERLPEAVAEIRTANDKFLPRIVFRLTKIRNMANQGLHIENQYTRE